MSPDSERTRDQEVTTIEFLGALAPHMWAIAIVFYGGGDVVTTAVGIPLHRTVEAGPLARGLYRELGVLSMVPLKLAVFGTASLLWRLIPAPQRLGVPLGLATLGVLVTAWNVAVIYGSVGG